MNHIIVFLAAHNEFKSLELQSNKRIIDFCGIKTVRLNKNNMRVLFVVGTRPEAIKMAPLIIALKENSNFESQLCVTGQHRVARPGTRIF